MNTKASEVLFSEAFFNCDTFLFDPCKVLTKTQREVRIKYGVVLIEK